MPAIVPYFAGIIAVVFGLGFYFALISFRRASDEDRAEGRAKPPEKK